MKKKKSKNKGFTLIELLVVIVIIGLLTGILLVNYNSVRQRGRDAKRKSDLHQVASALEIFKADNDSYPLSIVDSTGAVAGCGEDCDQVCLWGEEFSCGPDPSTIYMSKLPEDPLSGLAYDYSSNGTTYTLEACLENSADSDGGSVTVGSICTFGYQVINQ